MEIKKGFLCFGVDSPEFCLEDLAPVAGSTNPLAKHFILQVQFFTEAVNELLKLGANKIEFQYRETQACDCSLDGTVAFFRVLGSQS